MESLIWSRESEMELQIERHLPGSGSSMRILPIRRVTKRLHDIRIVCTDHLQTPDVLTAKNYHIIVKPKEAKPSTVNQ